MNRASVALQDNSAGLLRPGQGVLQRKCACGNLTIAGGECTDCANKNNSLQRMLSIGASNDPLEREADRVADQVMAMPSNSNINSVSPLIQRFTGQSSGSVDTVPASVDQVLAGSGRPLQRALRQDMEQRFGYGFSHVRVHSGAAAEQSVQDVSANAYTVGHNIVFGPGQFAPRTDEGRRLLAHELTHVVQQSGGQKNHLVQRQQDEETSLSAVSLGSCTTNNQNDPAEEFDCYFNSVLILYQGLFEKQESTLVILRDTAGKDDPPPFWHDLAVAALGIALAAATGGIGSAVALGVTRKLTTVVLDPNSKIGEAFIKIATDMAKDGAKAATKKVIDIGDSKVRSASLTYPEGDSERVAKIFFDSQRAALVDAKVVAQLQIVSKKGELKRGGQEGILVIKSLAEEITKQYDNAETLQRFESIAQWIVYQAKGVRGETSKGGVNLSRGSGVFTDDPGVLLLVGNWFFGKDLKLTGSSLDGINSALKPDISDTTIGNLKIPVKVKLEVGPELGIVEDFFSKKATPFVYFKRNEKGELFANMTFRYANMFLGERVGIHGQLRIGGGGRTTQFLSEDQVFNVVAIAFKKMKDKKPPIG